MSKKRKSYTDLSAEPSGREEDSKVEAADARPDESHHRSFSSTTSPSEVFSFDTDALPSDISSAVADEGSDVGAEGVNSGDESLRKPPTEHPLDSEGRHVSFSTQAGDATSSTMAIHDFNSDRDTAPHLRHGDDDTAFASSPTKKGSRIGATLQKLHFRSSSGNANKGGASTSKPASLRDAEPDHEHARKTEKAEGHVSDERTTRKSFAASGPGSGRQTPRLSKDVTGDFAEFLQAEELKERLAHEKESEVKNEFKATKAAKKHKDVKNSVAGHGLGGKGKAESPEERWQRAHAHDKEERAFAPGLPTLEQRGYFPGDLHHHGHLEVRKRRNARPQTSRHTSASTTDENKRRIRPPGICGPVSDSSSDEADSMHGVENAAERMKTRRRDSDASMSSSVASGSSTIAEPHDAKAARDINSSVMSLKSFNSDQTMSSSLLGSGANPKLAKPLLELEELELESFIKNFGRHTREVRVGPSAKNPGRRMPRWEDFRVPPGEAALAAAQGKRVTVLTHVDRGLRFLEQEEGEGGPRPREADAKIIEHKSDSDLRKERKKKERNTSASNSDAEDLNVSTARPNLGAKSSQVPSGEAKTASKSSDQSSSKQHVSWAPSVGQNDKESEGGQSRGMMSSDSKDKLSAPFARLREDYGNRTNRSDLEEGIEGADWIKEQEAVYNIHDDEVEYRPSRDEVALDDAEYELLHASVDEKLVADDIDGQVDGVAWAIAYILATIERYAPEELDNSPDQKYREGKTRSHIERLYLIAPFWERLMYGTRRVYRWDNPRRTSIFMMAYFVLWYMNLLATTFMVILMYYTCQFRFFPPSASYLHDQVRSRMARGVDADRLAERLRRRSRLDVLELYKRFVIAYGSAAQLACGDIADFHEKVKNLILWRDTKATWRTLSLLGIAAVFVTLAPTAVICKTITGFLGFTFFILLPLQSHYPRFRRPLSPVWWALWGAPTDQQFAIQLLRRRHLERQRLKHPPTAAQTMKKQAGEKGLLASDEFKEEPTNENGAARVANFKSKFLHRSGAAQAVAFGALKPFRSSTVASGGNASEKLLDLQTIKVLKDGEIQSRPRKLGSFFCQHHGVPGHLHVTTRMLYFVPLHSHATPSKAVGDSHKKTCKTALEDVTGILKTKSIKLVVWSSSGLQVTRRNKPTLQFSNMPHRDNAFNLLLAIGSEVWHEQE